MKEVIQLNGPHNDPDLNPIERLWGYCVLAYQATPSFSSDFTGLRDARTQIWDDIPQDTIGRLIMSMPQRCQACIQACGG